MGLLFSDDFVQFCADYIREEPVVVGAVVGVPVVLALAFFLLMRSDDDSSSRKTRKKKKKAKEDKKD